MYWRSLAVLTLVVLAGCNGFGFGEGQSGATTETLTPVPLSPSEGTTTDVPEALPPGVFPNGSVDVERLERAHERRLANRSFAWALNETRIRTFPEREETYWSDRRIEVDGDRFAVVVNEENRPTKRIFVDKDTGYARTETDDGGQTERLADAPPAESYLFADRMFELFLTNRTFQIDVIERDGQQLYRLFAAPTDERITIDDETNAVVWDLRVTAYVTADGLVRSMAVEYVYRSVSWRDRTELRFDYSGVGSTTVPQPDWATGTPTPPVTTTPTGNEEGRETQTTAGEETPGSQDWRRTGTNESTDQQPAETPESEDSETAGTPATRDKRGIDARETPARESDPRTSDALARTESE